MPIKLATESKVKQVVSLMAKDKTVRFIFVKPGFKLVNKKQVDSVSSKQHRSHPRAQTPSSSRHPSVRRSRTPSPEEH